MIRLSDNLEINKPAPVDDRLGVFVSTASALTSIAEDRRYVGLTVIVDDGSGAVEYWFQDGVTDVDLVAKSQGGGGGVPYTGATQNVDLGEYQMKAGQYEFDQTPTQSAGVAKLRWNDTDGTLDLGLKGGNVTLQIGQEEVIRVVNKTGSNLLESQYKVVRVRTQSEGGTQGQRLAVVLAQANNKANHSGVLGMVTENIDNNQEGFITTFGYIRNINTTGSLQGETWVDGDVLWLSESVAGGLTNIEPTTHPVQMGYVVYAHANNGKIFVRIGEGVDQLDELHDVSANNPSNRNGLFFNSSNNLWESRAIVEADLPTLNAYPRVYFVNSSASASVTTLAKIFEGSAINITDLRVGTTFICTGFYTGSASSTKGFGLSSNNTTPTLATASFTSGQFYFIARYIGGVNGTLRITRVGGNGFGVSATTSYVDINASSGTHTLSFWGSSSTGTIIVEHCLIQMIY
jgi:hypothetical protein